MQKTYIIAEMAWSHTGSLENAIEILHGVKDSGAQAIGIHITNLETYMTKNYKCIAGQTLSNTNNEDSKDNIDAMDTTNNESEIYRYLSKINLTHEDWIKFDKKATELGIDIIAMCNDIESFEFSKKLNIKKYVISAASFLELDFIKEILKENPHLIVRIGGATLSEIDNLVDFVLSKDKKASLELLVGIQLYPTPISEMHIGSIKNLKERYDTSRVSFGLADHIDGDNVHAKYLPALAIPYGITSIEKHITTSRKLKLEDYEAALGIKEFKEFVDFIKESEKAFGEPNLEYLINDSYDKYRNVSRKKIIAKTDIKEGEFISKDHICFMRSDFGCQISELDIVLNKKANKFIAKHDGVTLKDIV